MTEFNKVIDKLNSIKLPKLGFRFCRLDGYLWGYSSRGELAFGIESNQNSLQIIQDTKRIKFYSNGLFDVSIDDKNQLQEKLTILVLKDFDNAYKDIFVRLCYSFYLSKLNDLTLYFNQLRNLFSGEKKMSLIELQGFYAELFVIYYFSKEIKFDLSAFYQHQDKRKFDFSISEFKKVDIKSTSKNHRIHHFLNEQLNTLRYDIKIISVMLLPDDEGLNLNKLLENCRKEFSNCLPLILKIESIFKNTSKEQLESISFNSKYTIDNLRIYDSEDIPRLNERDGNGVFNIEYDSDLTCSPSMDISKFIGWIK